VPAQRAAAAREPRHDGADRHALDPRRLGIAQPLEAHQQQRLALLARHLGERPHEIAHFEPRLLLGPGGGLTRRHGLGRRRRAAAHVVDMDVVQNGKEPSAQIAARLPEMGARERAREAILHEVVDIAGVAQQAPRVAAQRRHVRGKRRSDDRRSALAAAAQSGRGRITSVAAPGHYPRLPCCTKL
jgi:hypothetical protein